VFALLALFAIVGLGQKLNTMEASLLHMTALEQQISVQSDMVQAQRQWLESQAQQLEQRLKQIEQSQHALVTNMSQWQKQQQAGWRLTDTAAIRFALVQLMLAGQVNPNPQGLRSFLLVWQQQLRAAEVADDDALMQAIAQELAALRFDVPQWHSQQAVWQSLVHRVSVSDALLSTDQTAPVMNQPETGLWDKLIGLIKVRPAGLSEQAMAQQLQQKSLWPVQTQLSLELVRLGFQRNQPELVQQSAAQLALLLQQQSVVLTDAEQAALVLWQQWQGVPVPSWSYLQALLSQREAAQP
jgi:hypothetical protein